MRRVEQRRGEVDVLNEVGRSPHAGLTTPGQRTMSGMRKDSSYIQRLSNKPCSPRNQPWSEL